MSSNIVFTRIVPTNFNETCSICRDPIKEAYGIGHIIKTNTDSGITNTVAHVFHETCVSDAFNASSLLNQYQCPYCRIPVNNPYPFCNPSTKARFLINTINQLVESKKQPYNQLFKPFLISLENPDRSVYEALSPKMDHACHHISDHDLLTDYCDTHSLLLKDHVDDFAACVAIASGQADPNYVFQNPQCKSIAFALLIHYHIRNDNNTPGFLEFLEKMFNDNTVQYTKSLSKIDFEIFHFPNGVSESKRKAHEALGIRLLKKFPNNFPKEVKTFLELAIAYNMENLIQELVTRKAIPADILNDFIDRYNEGEVRIPSKILRILDPKNHPTWTQELVKASKVLAGVALPLIVAISYFQRTAE